MPWPISGFLPTMVIVPSGAMVTKALSGAALAEPVAARTTPGIVAESMSPPPASTLARSRVRRETLMVLESSDIGRGSFLGGHLDGLADAAVTGAAADVALHRLVDLVLARIGVLGEQRARGHQLAGLAIAALHHVDVEPGLLQRLA